MGLEFIRRPQEDKLKTAIELSSIQLDNVPLVDLDEFLLILSNYYLFLGSQSGILAARARVLSDDINDKVAKRGAKIEGGTAHERRALIISTDEEMGRLNNRLLETRAKLSMLEPVYDAIKMKIDSLKRIYFRRTSERRN